MKKYLLFGISLITGISFAQQEVPTFERCLSHKLIEAQELKTPGFAAHVDEQFEIAKNSPLTKSGPSEYTIPVVVHVVYDPETPEQNIHDSIVLNQIEILNNDYNRRNADTVNMRSDFDIIAGSPKIKFRLATIDPNGNPTTGITRTEADKYSFGDLSVFTNGDFGPLEEIKSTQNGGIDPWDQSRYMNIWVGNMEILGLTALLGYATPPANLPNWPGGTTAGMSDGVVIQYQAFGSNNPNPLLLGGGAHTVLGRTLTHEVGHYLGLRHIWGDGDCTNQDGIDDTPNAIEQSTGCDTTANTCIDNIQGFDLPDMLENYMDYTNEDCQNSFTEGQVDLMHGVLENQRYDLVYNNPASVSTEELVATIYPNPTRNVLNIQLDNGVINAVEVYNAYGQKLISSEESNSAIQLDVSELKQGVYFVRIFTNTGSVAVERFVKE
ncbi:M43 family zinc metalloprotease [Brumimicrobium oceani]|uniref:Uncharacterized protein n=1 Tax=Brumimicrobium oceani TaxID=2100725 RepID=A0A2U2XBZ2_9FLAO|nr:M43 family zinc metalloprotease [Brumimicrobium oceani]PWH85315.1 hypothetical protein DIT68_10285 [Brumimicrobium oceani]